MITAKCYVWFLIGPMVILNVSVNGGICESFLLNLVKNFCSRLAIGIGENELLKAVQKSWTGLGWVRNVCKSKRK